jgi:hypothetical protein
MGAPVAASTEMVAAALAPNGEPIRAQLVKALQSRDKAEAERAARSLKKIAEADRDALYSLRKPLLKEAFRAEDVRVQWNLTIAIGRLPLTGRDKAVAVDLMFERLRDPSGLNRTFAMQALMDLSEDDPPLRTRVLPIVREALEHGTPAMIARAKRLLKPVR